MIKIQVTDTTTREIRFNDKRSGQQRSFKIQNARVFLANNEGKIDDVAERFEISLNNDAQPFDIGIYTLTPNCIYLDRNGRLQVGVNNMKKIAEPVKNVA